MIKNLIKNIKVGKAKIFLLIVILFFYFSNFAIQSDIDLEGNFLEIKILDKVSSKNHKLNIKICKEEIFKNISIKPLKCKNSEFDDNPEITAYIQVKDLKNEDNDEVFIFNGWTFASDSTIALFDHAIYDLQLVNCNNV